MNSVDLKEYLPEVYDGVIEMETVQDALSIEVNKLQAKYEKAIMDQFIQKAGYEAIDYYENIFNIIAKPEVESLQFRRDRVLSRMKSLVPPYTYWYFRMMFDRFFGKGQYDLQVDHDNYQIILESSADDALWYHEIQVSVTATKPCNMIFVNKPRITSLLRTNEEITSAIRILNYKLNGEWQLGLRPFVTAGDEEIRKMPETKSVQPIFINRTLDEWKKQFTKSIINDTITKDDLLINIVDDCVVIEYTLLSTEVSNITNIKLQDSTGETLINSQVFIPVEDSVIIKHKIKLEEGVNAKG